MADVVAVGDQERLRQQGILLVPAVLFAQLLCELTGFELGEDCGQGLSELRAFPRYFGADCHKEHHHQCEQQSVNDGNRQHATAQQALQAIHQRAHQVGEENGEQKSNQSGTGHVEKPQGQCKQEHRDQNPRRT